MKAVFVRNLEGFRGNAKLYRVDPPVTYGYDEDRTTEYVIVSAITADFSGPETYIFPGDERGNILSWAELEGSFRGALDHEQALNRAGYEVES